MTPSKIRRQGREAFDPSIDNPMEFCSYQSEYAISTWMEGWEEGKKVWESEQQESNDIDSLHDEIMAGLETGSVSDLVKLLIKKGILS